MAERIGRLDGTAEGAAARQAPPPPEDEIDPRRVRPEDLLQSADEGYAQCEIVTDAAGRPVDYRFLRVNEHFGDMTGLHDATGRTAREMIPGLGPDWVEAYARVAFDRVPMRYRLRSVPAGRYFEVLALPFGPPGQFMITFYDISESARVADEREAALERSRMLLQELNHRVMNSLGMIAAIVNLESRIHPDGQGKKALGRVGQRVQAVADLYKTLNGARSPSDVGARCYLGALVSSFCGALGDGTRIVVETEIEEVRISSRLAGPMGLVVNELMTNALKHAFPVGGAGTIRLGLTKQGPLFRLTVADDGAGLHRTDGAARDGGIGRQIVRALTEERGGTMTVDSGPGGTCVTVTFRDDESQA